MTPRVRFDRNEFSGAFGDIGTDLPLIIGIILASGMDSTNVLVVYGLLQILTALTYGIPMPVEPLKAVATLVIAQRISGNIIAGAGLTIGLVMLVLTATGLLAWLARAMPASVIRGIQFGLGLQLSLLALTNYVHAEGFSGYLLAIVCFTIIVLLFGNRKTPPALIVIALGIAYALIFRVSPVVFADNFGIRVPAFHMPATQDLWQGFLLLALPQIPLSIGNSILATERLARDYFPESRVTISKIGYTYSSMNLIAPFLGGIPVCHGSGGMAGHYAFGARTGGSVLIYGVLYIILGVFFGRGFAQVIQVFPLPVLGVILLFEGVALIRLMRDMTSSPPDLIVTILVGLMAAGLPYGYVVALVLGPFLAYYLKRLSTHRSL